MAREKILIVEDELSMAKQLEWGLTDIYETCVATDAGEARTLIAQHSPIVVLLDLGLPPDPDGAEEGLEFLKEIHQERSSIKVIVITGNTDRENAVRAISLGAYDYHTKPVNIDELNIVLKRAIYLSKLEQHLIRALSRSADWRIVRVRGIETGPVFPADQHNLDSLVNWSLEAGGSYLVMVTVDDRRLERRKGFHIPLVAHKYETVGVATGELRLIDVARGRQVLAEPFRIEKRGPRVFQATMDDDINDPDLHLRAPQKAIFAGELDDKLSRHLVKRIGSAIRIRKGLSR